MKNFKKIASFAFLTFASSAFAAPVPPVVTTFGPLPAASFGGLGIPNNAVEITTISKFESPTVTLGLTATPRFGSPAVTNNGAGVFQAANGVYAPGDNLAKWNFDFYIDPQGSTLYTYKLLADYNPGVGTDLSAYTDVSAFLSAPDSLKTTGKIQNSENLGFGTGFAQFDPGVAGEYGFVLQALNLNGSVAGTSAILVTVPEPSSIALLGLAMLGMVGGMYRRR